MLQQVDRQTGRSDVQIRVRRVHRQKYMQNNRQKGGQVDRQTGGSDVQIRVRKVHRQKYMQNNRQKDGQVDWQTGRRVVSIQIGEQVNTKQGFQSQICCAQLREIVRNCSRLRAIFKSLQGSQLSASKIYLRWKP